MVTNNETSIIITEFLFSFSLYFTLLSFSLSLSLSLFLFIAEERQTKAKHLYLNDYRDSSEKKDDDDDYCSGVNGICATLHMQAGAQ